MFSPEPVISVVAPPGYGKTTLLTQWAERLASQVAWVSCERSDNDPVTLWNDVLTALDHVEQVPGDTRHLLSSVGVGISAVPRLVASLSRLEGPVVLVLDHVEVITSPHSLMSIAELAVRLPQGWRLALASRDTMPLPLARMRVERTVLEIGAADLAMSAGEAAALLRHAGATVSREQADELVERTEGWAAGLYLAALAIESGIPAPGYTFTGEDRFVEDYLRSELLSHLSSAEVGFLVRTSILDRMCGSLCDAVLEVTGSARMLRRLEQHNLLVVPLDRRGEWYRYHHLFRELLQAELRRSNPELADDLHARAAVWYEAHDMPEAAIDHAAAAGAAESAARIVLGVMQPVWARGRVETVRSWMELLDRWPKVRYRAAIAAHGALIFALLGRAREAERWVGVAEGAPAEGTLPDGNTETATLAYLSAILCRHGPQRMRADAEAALAGLTPSSPYRATMEHSRALSWLLEGDLARADELFTHAYDRAIAVESAPLVGMILAEQSMVASARGDHAESDILLKQALETVEVGHLDAYWTSALVFAAAARSAVGRGEMREARHLVERAAALRPLLTYVLPVVSVQALLELAHAYLGLVDPGGATAVLEQAERIVQRRRDLGVLPEELRRLKARVGQITEAAPVGTSSLTTAELRLLPLLPTHLSFREIAAQLYVSPHTVRSHVKSIYRKLGVSSRSEAVDLLAERGRR
jgi:LuxR family transcriptional regulator, maltose regulon positive regulatory protein